MQSKSLIPRLVLAAACALVAIDAASAQPPLRSATIPSSSRAERTMVEVARVPYQAYLAADCIPGSNFCKFAGESVTGRRRLEIERVACQGWHSSETPPNYVVIAELRTAANSFVRRIDFLETSNNRVGTNSVWAISESVLIFIPSAHKLHISLNSASTGVGSYGCTLSGHMVTFAPA
jgi:hypothetical protein